MKKAFKIISIIIVVIAVLVGGLYGYERISDTLEEKKLNNERINAKTLMEYVKTHSYEYIDNSDETMYFTAESLICDALDNIKIFTSDYFITKDNEIYDISFNELYSNNQNCKKREIDKKIKDIKYENKVSYNRIIFLDSNNNVFYDDLTKYDEEHFSIQNKILKDNNIQMIFPSTIDTKLIKEYYKNDNFYQDRETTILVLKRDNKLYKQVYINNQYKHNINFKSEEIYKSLEEYGNIQQIAMSDYYSNNNGKSYKLEDNTITTIISDKGYYYLEEIKTDECIKYKDIECKLELKESEIYKRFSKDIKFIGEQYTILSDNSIIETRYLTYPLDKDLKN